ncbi:3-methylcrotonoyl-CoA carboxylase alpha subunit [Roseiarcus fermentans]|uniref:3-methylcrotonoyl-CoA carboxylase alpha subunit n=1 Tax=Roseiarcus fermentans TaxID=1473586 RepID=A0A366EZQ4_9HYPH|nr:biotin carboxylase N-terminal domain-containing protein [Roseiarcus fermentans]RBP07356.1 3-methylcrotonoyl-CoA carboxylase alpha subunit [Roseiarcus fermentans]
MFANVLVANRGEIACRIIRTARRMGIRAIVMHTPADRSALFTRLADEAHEIGEGASGYLDGAAIVALARRVGAECLHPGYGFLSENADFAELCGRAGIVFIGPPPAAMRAMGLKNSAKALMQKAGVPVVPGYHGDNQSPKFLREKAYEIGYPVLIKAIAGGGGRGMRRVDAHVEFEAALESASREGLSAFGDGRVLIEKLVAAPRHIEMQVFADGHGHCVHLFERDCSLQRRHQKVIEECPSPGLPEETRAAMAKAATEAALAVGYQGAGTVEFIADASRGLGPGDFWFLEMNTRLQVEHPVTEAVTGLDLVEWQFRVAAGEPLPRRQEEIVRQGAAIEARIYAEDPEQNFLPSPGRILTMTLGSDPDAGVRVDTGVEAGDSVTPFYDAMIAKLIVHGATRADALAGLARELDRAVVIGPKTNLAFLRALAGRPEIAAGAFDTGFIDQRLASLGATPRPPDPRAVLAAARLLIDRADAGRPRPASPFDPWGVFDSFELMGARRVGLDVLVDGRPERLHVIEAGRALAVADRHTPAGADGAPPTLLETADGVFAFAGGRQAYVRLIDPLERSAGGADEGDGGIRAPMNGRVAALLVGEGDRVEAGQRLAVIEAMKMEHALTAPFAGLVRDLTSAVGEQVEMGERILLIEADPG